MSAKQSCPTSIPELIDRWAWGPDGLWGAVAEFARAVGVKYQTARKWRERGCIPMEHWPAVVAASRKKRVRGISLEWLAKACLETAS
ncbi:carph-isopro domain-containing protein [uncultured Pleomorphomonas sp.]|uniref:carph-isopro domain-containing protein n=1 Tax=uncultured Pleomorphomonas sp. TaxID=442121 RepID=UPI00338E76B9